MLDYDSGCHIYIYYIIFIYHIQLAIHEVLYFHLTIIFKKVDFSKMYKIFKINYSISITSESESPFTSGGRLLISSRISKYHWIWAFALWMQLNASLAICLWTLGLLKAFATLLPLINSSLPDDVLLTLSIRIALSRYTMWSALSISRSSLCHSGIGICCKMILVSRCTGSRSSPGSFSSFSGPSAPLGSNLSAS